MEKKSIPTPKAPVKYKKQPKKGDLKPKKLYYTDDELDASNTIDSLFHKHTTRCNRFDSSQKQIRRLRAKLDRIKVQTNDKENDRNVLGNRSVNVVNNRNNVAQESSVGRCINSEKKCTHMLKTNTDVKEKLTHFRV